MGIVTDKELLTFCNLTNLKMEYAKLKYFDTDKKEEVNHTIYSLIDTEVKSFKSEIKNILYEIKKIDNQLKNTYTISEKRQLKEMKKQLIDQYEQMDTRKAEGIFYLQEEEKEIEYIYLDEDELCNYIDKESLGAPYLMERYIKARDCENTATHNFISEWTVLDYFDNYMFAKTMYDKLKLKQSQTKKTAEIISEVLSKKNNLSKEEEELNLFLKTIKNPELKRFPTRKEVKENKDIKLILTGLRVIGKVGINMLGGQLIGNVSNQLPRQFDIFNCLENSKILEFLRLSDDEIKNLGFPESFKELVKYSGKLTGRVFTEVKLSNNQLDKENKGKEILENILETSTETEAFTTDYEMSLAGLKQTIDLTATGVGCLLLKKNDENLYVIALKNNENLYILDENLNTGEIPKEIFQLIELVEELKEKHKIPKEAKIHMTGIGNAAKLVSLYKVFDSEMQCKGYFSKEPLNIGTIVDFTPRDISLITRKKYTTNLEIISQSFLGENKVDNLPMIVEGLTIIISGIISGSLLTLGSLILISVFLISNFKDIWDQFREQKSFEEAIQYIFKELQKKGFIGTFYEEDSLKENKSFSSSNIYEKRYIYKPTTYPHFKDGEILGKIFNLEKSFKATLNLDLDDIGKKIFNYSMFSSIKDIYINREKEINFQKIDNYINIVVLLKINNYFILELTDKEIILANKELENIIIYQIEKDNFIKLKYKSYNYYELVTVFNYPISKIEKIETQIRFKPSFDSTNYFSQDKIPKPVDEHNLAPEQNILTMKNEIFEFCKKINTEGKYFETDDASTIQLFGKELSNLLKTFKEIQSKYIQYKEKKSFGISYIKDNEEEYLKILNYTLKKEEIPKSSINILKDYKICKNKIIPCVDETTGKIPL